MADRGFFLTWHAVRRQLAAMPYELYLVRLIHHATRRAFPGERLWTAAQLSQESTVKFLRIRNREGCNVYIQPYADRQNAGYILLDLDHGDPGILDLMRAKGHEPCVVLQTSPGHLQAWIQLSALPLQPAVATAIARHLAHKYQGDLASADWRHLGRLAGFSNQKPHRCQDNGYAPWVRLLYAHVGFASQASSLVLMAEGHASGAGNAPVTRSVGRRYAKHGVIPAGDPSPASTVYQVWLNRLHIPQRFPQPDWSIADKWIAKELLQQGTPAAVIADLLREGSPGFPRRHADPEDYLRRTLARARWELEAAAVPAAPRSEPCVPNL